MEVQKSGWRMSEEDYSFHQATIVTLFHTYLYQSEIYECQYFYSNGRNWLVEIGLWGAIPCLHN